MACFVRLLIRSLTADMVVRLVRSFTLYVTPKTGWSSLSSAN